MATTSIFGVVLKRSEKIHKSKPRQFVSVAGGVQKRLESDIKNRKSKRLTTFDNTRDLPICESPAPISEAQKKMEHRRQQLEKWKLEKEQKKKQQAAQKKKPFVTGVARAPLRFVLPPPLPKPGTSGPVTRSQTKSAVKPQYLNPKTSPAKTNHRTKSFAPKNASFKPPEMKNCAKLLRPVLTRQNATESKQPPAENRTTRGRVIKKIAPQVQSSSSSSDMESVQVRVKSSQKSLKKPEKFMTRVLAMGSSSESSDSSQDKSKRKSLKSTQAVKDSESSSDKLSTDDDVPPQRRLTRKSLPTNFSPRPHISLSSDRVSSDVEFVDEVKEKLTRMPLPITPLKTNIPKSESSSEEKLRSPKSPFEQTLTPEQMEAAKISPCVTMSRGKDNARKEMKWKIHEGLLDEDASDVDSVDYFRRQLSSEIKRMTDMCETWDKISQQVALPEFVQEAVLSAVGLARLLMSSKLQQFASLLDSHDSPGPGASLITPADLRGFWDMVFLQIENVDLRFKKLEELRRRDWVEEQLTQGQANNQTNKRVAGKRAAKPVGAASRIKEMIAAARKAKKQQEQAAPPADAEKTFDAGFFCVRSPVRSPIPPSTPAGKPNLLKAVLSSEAKKTSSKNSTPFAMLRASMLAKNAEYEGVAPLPQTPQINPINIFATPGRSILKSTNAEHSRSGKKSIKVVLFDPTGSEGEGPSPASDAAYHTARDVDYLQTQNDATQNKENSPSPEVTRRSQRKSVSNTENVEAKTRRRSSRNKHVEDGTEDKKTPIRASGRKKVSEVDETGDGKTSKRSTRKKALQNAEANVVQETVPTPKRSSKRNKVKTMSRISNATEEG